MYVILNNHFYHRAFEYPKSSQKEHFLKSYPHFSKSQKIVFLPEDQILIIFSNMDMNKSKKTGMK